MERIATVSRKIQKGQAARTIVKPGQKSSDTASGSISDGVTGEQLALDLHTDADLDQILITLFD